MTIFRVDDLRTEPVVLASGDFLRVTSTGRLRTEGTALVGRGEDFENTLGIHVAGSVQSRSDDGAHLRGFSVNLTVGSGGVIETTGRDGAAGLWGLDLVGAEFKFANAGRISGQNGAVLIGGDGFGQNTGLIEAVGTRDDVVTGLSFGGFFAVFENGGVIRSTHTGVLMGDAEQSFSYFENSGEVSGNIGVWIEGGKGHSFLNLGTVTGNGGTAFLMVSRDSELNNQSLIEGDIVGADGRQSVFNDGTIEGAVRLGGGSDRFNSLTRVTGVIDGGAGEDWLFAGVGADRVLGGAGADWLMGGENGDVLRGGAGGDRLDGGTGWDNLTGGAGADVFEFAGQHGTDRIEDFEIRDDRIDLTAFGFADYADMLLKVSWFNGWGGLILDLALEVNGGRIVLTGLTVDALTEDMFVL